MEFAGQMEADFIDKTGQINPASHDLAGAAGIDGVGHGEYCGG